MFESDLPHNGYANGHIHWSSHNAGASGTLNYDAGSTLQYSQPVQQYSPPTSGPTRYTMDYDLDVDLAASSLGNGGGGFVYSTGTAGRHSPGQGYRLASAAADVDDLDGSQPYANLPAAPLSPMSASLRNGYANSIGSQSQQQHHYHLYQRDFATTDGRIRHRQLQQPADSQSQQQHEYVNYRDPDVVAMARAASVDGAAGGLSRSDKFGTLASLNSTGRYASSTIGDSRQRILPYSGSYSFNHHGKEQTEEDGAFANPGYSDLGDFYPMTADGRAVSPYSQSHRSLVSASQVSRATPSAAQPMPAEPAASSATSPPPAGYRDPELPEVLQLLRNGSEAARCHAAAYLQHLTFCEEDNKTRVRTAGGIPLLVNLLARPAGPELRLSVLGALRNLSYGLGQEENRREMARNGLLASLCALLDAEMEVRELVTAVLWNLSASHSLRRDMLDSCVLPLVNQVLLPHAGLEQRPNGEFSSVQRESYAPPVFRNATGALRCLSAFGEDGYGRKRLRSVPGLVESIIQVLRSAVSNRDLDGKSVENCVCLLRNLLYACQEAVDPGYKPADSVLTANASGANGKSGKGCFGGKSNAGNKKKPNRKPTNSQTKNSRPLAPDVAVSNGRGGILWHPGTMSSLLMPIIADCTNAETLEAASGAVQNLAACDWQPSVEFRAQVRQDKGLPLLVELLSLEADRVVRTAATALRNLALDQRNLGLIGKFALEALASRLPRRNSPIANSPDTYAAIIATLYTVVKANQEFARRLAELGGPSGLILVRDAPSRYGQKAAAFAARLLDSMQQLLGKDVQLTALQNRPQAEPQPAAAAAVAANPIQYSVSPQASASAAEPTYAQIDKQKKLQQRAQMQQQQFPMEQVQPQVQQRQQQQQQRQHHHHSHVYEQAADSWV